MTTNSNLKLRILLPLAAVLVIIFGASIFSLYRQETQYADEIFERDLQSVRNHYQRDVERRAEKMGAVLEAILRDEQLQAALHAKDRDALFKRATPLFNDLKTKYSITHFYFHDPARINLLRVHMPQSYGDTVNRFTLLTAEKTGKLAYGVELGQTNTFTLRVVAPWRDQGKLIGYVELGEEIQGVLQDIKDAVGVEYVVVMDKQFLNRQEWEAGMRMLGRTPDWDHLPSAVIAQQTVQLPDDILTLLLSRQATSGPAGMEEFFVGDRHFHAGGMALKDDTGRKVGSLLVLSDMSAHFADIRATFITVIAVYVVLGGVLFAVFYLILGRVERQMAASRNELLQEGKMREELQARHIAELEWEQIKLRQAQEELQKSEESLSRAQQVARLGSWDWDVARNELHWSAEMYRLFGVVPQNGSVAYETFLEFIHPEDRSRAQQALKAAVQEKKPFSVEHRAILADGSERTMHIQAEVILDDGGNVARVTGTVQDITQRRQAEENLRLADKVFENSIEGIMITDARGTILRVNKAFTGITGYSQEEIVGKSPRVLRSNRHDDAFYRDMWAMLLEYGYWQGEIWNRRKTGEVYPEWQAIIAIRDERGEAVNYLAVFADISKQKVAEERAQHLAYYDALTELPNRMLMLDRLRQALIIADANKWRVAVLYLDLDRFKSINDTLGHPFGDKLLQAVAGRLSDCVSESDTFARFSGDKFTAVLTNLGNKQDAAVVAQGMLDALAEPFVLEGHEVFVSPSIGIASYPQDAGNGDDLVKNAEAAMYHAKEWGGNGYRFYNADMNATASKRITMENGLRRALERGEFVLYYQPQLSLRSGRIIGMEALLRWQHPELGLVAPGEFIPLLEENGLIVRVGEWVLRTACTQNRAWQEEGLPPLRVAVNLSVYQFRQSDLVDAVRHALEDAGLEPKYLELEITESTLIQDVQATITTLQQLHELGVQIAVDDFGTGYSSLSYLKRLPIHKIKIDRSFVQDICCDPDDSAIASAIISLGHSLNMQVIAEGVETEEQLRYLREEGCDKIQGYLFSRPLPADAFLRIVKEKAGSQ
ncbi:MAG: EAL domain-containing protein [Pseudomonadota bacterium]